jgi:hypothetical protein
MDYLMFIIKQVLPDWSETEAQRDVHVRAFEAGLNLGKKVETDAVTHITSVVGAVQDIMKLYAC